MKDKFKILLLLFWIIIFDLAGAAMRLQLKEENGRSVLERNSQYQVYTQVVPDIQRTIGAIGELYVEYDKNIFEEINSLATDYHILPSSIWESEKITFNHSYASSTQYRCIEYAKTDNNGPFWTISSTQNIFALLFKVKKNAPTGNTQIRFIYSSDNSRTKMISSAGAIIPLSIANLTVFIDLDRTAPTTDINYPGGIYNYVPEVKLRPNEDSIVHYMVIGGGNIWNEQPVSANVWSNVISLPSTANEVKYSTIQYYGEDLALDKAHNIEAVKAYLFTIDLEAPAISNIQVPSEATPIGSIAEIQFELFDQGGINSVQVTVGGQPAYLYSGSSNGVYVFRRTIDGSETQNGNLVISVSDQAGNSTSDNTASVLLDFNGPEFINITTSPATPQIRQEILISFNATETLKENPLVMVGNNQASFVTKTNLNYTYSYTVTANGWYIDLDFLPDSATPFTERNIPQKYSSTVPKNTSVYFRISDSESTINTENMLILINGTTVYYEGDFISGYKGRIVDLDGLPNVFCIPPTDFAAGGRITINICVADSSHNTLNETYYFDTSLLTDRQKPEIDSVFPSNNATEVECDTVLYFELKDNSGCGIARDRVTMDIVERALISSGQPDTSTLLSYPVLRNGVFQEGFSGTITPDQDGNLIISVRHTHNFGENKIIACNTTFEDLAREPSVGTGNWTFTTIRTTDATASSGRKPLAWPTIYDPTNKEGAKQLLTFNLKKPGTTYLRMYDLSGDMIWEYKYEAQEGYQAIPWDGRNGRHKIPGNGPYIWYIIQNNKVVGRGISILMK